MYIILVYTRHWYISFIFVAPKVCSIISLLRTSTLLEFHFASDGNYVLTRLLYTTGSISHYHSVQFINCYHHFPYHRKVDSLLNVTTSFISGQYYTHIYSQHHTAASSFSCAQFHLSLKFVPMIC